MTAPHSFLLARVKNQSCYKFQRMASRPLCARVYKNNTIAFLKRLYWTFHGKLSVLRTLEFIDGLNRPLKDQVTITDPNQEKEELLAIEAKLPF
jgi:hypothetical protein